MILKYFRTKKYFMPKIVANNIKLYYEIHGKGKPLVLISGLATSHHIWLPLIDELKKENEVLIFDNRSIGDSEDPKEPYTIDDMAKDTLSLIENLGLKKPHVLGTSMGGSIAQSLAINYGDKIDKLILDSTTFKLNYASCLASDFVLALYKAKLPVEQKALGFIPWLYSPDFLENPKNFQKALKDFLSSPFPTEKGFQKQLEALKNFNSKGSLEKINNTTLILRGSKDILVHEDETETLVQNIEKASYYSFKNAGHLVCLEKKEAYMKAVLDFINEKIFFKES